MIISPLNRPLALASIYLERYGLSVVFFYLALRHWHTLTADAGNERALIEAFPLLEIFRQIAWIQFDVFTGFMLLTGNRVTVPPRTVKDLLIPLSTTFFCLLYEATPWFPAVLNRSLCDAAWQPACVAAGLAFNLLGLCISMWAALSLGRSFAVLVEVRKVVMHGAYRWVRHPIYFGYLFFLSGFALGNLSLAYFILLPIHFALMVYRARLEEERLAEASPEYRAYQKRTGFIFPKLFTSPATDQG